MTALDKCSSTVYLEEMQKAEGSSHRKSVLIVDSNRDAANEIAVNLGRVGFRILVADSSASAVTQLSQDLHAVVIDDELPDGDGSLLCRRIRAMEWANRVPVILLSAEERPDIVMNKLSSSGASRVVRKPVLPADLIHLLVML